MKVESVALHPCHSKWQIAYSASLEEGMPKFQKGNSDMPSSSHDKMKKYRKTNQSSLLPMNIKM